MAGEDLLGTDAAADVRQSWNQNELAMLTGATITRFIAFSLGTALLLGSIARASDARWAQDDDSDQGVATDSGLSDSYATEILVGRFVWFAEGLKLKYDIDSVREAQDRTPAILTDDGRLIPIVEDVRGRSFRIDERLREMHLELVVRRYEGAPAVQIIRIHELIDGRPFIVDYWCDICAITMFEDGPCACCQEANRLRKRPADDPR